MFLDNLQQDLFSFLPLALESNQYGYFIPDIFKTCGIVGLSLSEDGPVGDMDNASRTLIGLNPVPDLQQGELENPDINHVPCKLPYLDPVSQSKWLSGKDKDPACNIGERILERYGQACGE